MDFRVTTNRHTSEPVRDILARAGKCAPGNDKGTVIGTPSTHSIVRVSAHHGAVKVVGIIFSPITRVNEIGVSSAVSKGWAKISSAKWSNDDLTSRRCRLPCSILDHVWRADELAVW